MLDWDEQIKAHLVWIWMEGEGFLKRGKEGMLVITDRRFIFITKTNMTYRVHDVHSVRQLKRFQAGENIFRPLEGYGTKNLDDDLKKSTENYDIPFTQILDITAEDKRWGTILKLKINLGIKTKTSKFSIVKGWVKYPLKDPVEFQHVNWDSIIDLVERSR